MAPFFKIKNPIFAIDKHKQLGGLVQPDDKVAAQPRDLSLFVFTSSLRNI